MQVPVDRNRFEKEQNNATAQIASQHKLILHEIMCERNCVVHFVSHFKRAGNRFTLRYLFTYHFARTRRKACANENAPIARTSRFFFISNIQNEETELSIFTNWIWTFFGHQAQTDDELEWHVRLSTIRITGGIRRSHSNVDLFDSFDTKRMQYSEMFDDELAKEKPFPFSVNWYANSVFECRVA